MSGKIICWFNKGLTVGDVATIFSDGAYDYVLDVDDAENLVLREPS